MSKKTIWEALNSWERVKMAIEHKNTDRVPVDYSAVSEITERLQKELNCSDYDSLLEVLGVDFREISPTYIGPKDRYYGSWITERPSQGEWKDIWGVVRKPVINMYGSYNEIVYYPLAKMNTVKEIEDYDWPKIEWFDFSNIYSQIKRWDKSQKRWIKASVGGAFESPWYMRGFEKFIMDMMDRPELCEAIIRNVVKFHISMARELFEASKGRLDMIETGGDIAGQENMMISPLLWRQQIKPYSQLLIQTHSTWGAKTMYHSDGNIRTVINDFIDMGLDVLDPIQPLAKDMEPVSIKTEFGSKITLHGAIDEQELLPHADSKKVREHVRYLIDELGKDGGYILAAAQTLQADCPTKNIIAMYEEAGSMG